MIGDIKIDKWSFSKSNLYKKCPRAYYYSIENLGFNKDKISIIAVVGLAVHFGIKKIIDKWSSNETIRISEIHKEVKSHIRYLVENKSHYIIEKYNGFELEENTIPKFNSIVTQQINRFYRLIQPNIKRQQYITHEKLDFFDIDNIRIWVKLDLFTKLTDKYYITDWKTDRRDYYYPYIRQLYVYAMWARNKYRIPYRHLVLQVINLSKGSYHQIPHNINSINNIKKSIVEKVNNWKSLECKNNFRPNPTFDNCKRCLYFKKCSEGKKLIKICQWQ